MIRPPQAAPDTGVRRVPGNGSPTLQQSAPAQTVPQVAPQPIARDDGWCDAPTDSAYNRPVKLPYPEIGRAHV